jgi:diguanylate cyclase (GGDEF)-like protein
MMPETPLQDGITVAEKIRHLIETTPMTTQIGSLEVTVSIGVASVPHTRTHSSKELIVAADKALYRAKKNGRNQVQAERRRDGLARTTRVREEENEGART